MSKNKKQSGVLYLRYDKSTFGGQIIERLKQKSNYKLNKRILNLIFLSEIVELLNLHDVDREILGRVYYQSLKLFSDKLELTNHKIKSLTEETAIQKNREPDLSLERQELAKFPLAAQKFKELSS